jgi:hypothetical protein
MIWKNPFQIKNFEQNDSDITYLDLFNSSALSIIKEDMFEISTYITSTPGAGKTSLFKAFSSNVLQIISKKQYQDTYNEIYTAMVKNKVIIDGRVKLLTCQLSCARNYDMLDEMFTNGRRKQMFFALLNYRIAIAFIRSICILFDTTVEEGAHKIHFDVIPDEMISEKDYFSNGASLFQWACDNERQLCKYLDSNREQEIEVSFMHTTLMIIKLFEPNNILVNEQRIFDKSLIIFDDLHKLSDSQKKNLVDSIYVLRAKVGVWFGERMEGLTTSQIISLDGSLSREYNEKVFIDDYWYKNNAKFVNMLYDVANRRVRKANLIGLEDFSSCVSNELVKSEYDKQAKKRIDVIKNIILRKAFAKEKYSLITEYINNLECDLLERVLYYECICIKIKREEVGQIQFYLGEIETVDSFLVFYNANKKVAEYYFCIKNDIPYYYGEEKIMAISSSNIEQFLYIAAGIFERSRAVFLGNKKASNKYKLSASEQEKYILQAVKNKWEDMHYRYSDAGDIQKFLNNMGLIGNKTRDSGRNSYNGGAITGIGIKSIDVLEANKNRKYTKLLDILGKCIASKYLEKKIISHDGEYFVFYFNRWLCVYYGLPLSYGGWRQISIQKAADLCEESASFDDDEILQLSLFGE